MIKKQHIENLEVKPILFLDLDGTVRKPTKGKQFAVHPQDYELYPNIEKLIWSYRENGFIIAGITNQGGVSHGFKTPIEVEQEIDFLISLFTKSPFHIIKACLHQEGGKVFPYNRKSLCRKPNIGMLALIECELHNHGFVIDWDNSMLIGDREEDRKCAENAELKFIWADSWRGDKELIN